MAAVSKKKKTTGTVLVIVESPTKAATVRKHLGAGYDVQASVGHVRDLVTRKTDLHARDKRRDAKWVNYGVNTENGFEPLEEIYRVPPTKRRQIDLLKAAVKESDALYLATDDDREGEAISWHLLEELAPKVPVHRLVFHEITAPAIKLALADPRAVDMNLVNAQRARRVVDRLYGWDVSQILWRKIKPGLSAGRVQSVALRMLCEREVERINFQSHVYWDLQARFVGAQTQQFEAMLIRLGDRRVAASRDFDPRTGEQISNGSLVLDGSATADLVKRLANEVARVTRREVKPQVQRPQPPFTTSTLQQEANKRLRFSAQRTMRVAQSLYENGYITYMRTDSTRMATEATDASRAIIGGQYGANYLPPKPRLYVTKSAGAQEAHEAIRPSGAEFVNLQAARKALAPDQFRLYELIWRRTIASQMADAQLENTSVDIRAAEATFRASGRTIRFDGYLRAWRSAEQREEDKDDKAEAVLPIMAEGDALAWAEPDPMATRERETRPRPRLNDASLVRALEEKGIGRPSTYATIIQHLLDRAYCFRRATQLVPTFMGMAVVRVLEEHMPHLVDYSFTAAMEAQLDAIACGEAGSGAYLRAFYTDGFPDLNDGKPVLGLTSLIAEVRDRIDPAVASRIDIGTHEGTPVQVRIGRYGTFIKVGEDTASLPDEQAPDELNVAAALALIEERRKGNAPMGTDADGTEIFMRNGRYGWYLQLGNGGETEKPRMVSLSRGMKPEDVTLELAVSQLSLPRDLGNHPDKAEPITAHVGRYGDYIKCGTDTRTLPAGQFAVNVDRDAAITLLATRRKNGREMIRELGTRASDGVTIALWTGRWGPYLTDGSVNKTLGELDPAGIDLAEAIRLLAAAAEAKNGRLLGTDPDKGTEVRLLEGRFGPYVTNGHMNASLLRGMGSDEVDLDEALLRLRDFGKPVKKRTRKASGAAAGSRAAKKPAKKAATKKTAAKKTAAKKKAPTKKTAPKKKASVKAAATAALPPSRTGIRRKAAGSEGDTPA